MPHGISGAMAACKYSGLVTGPEAPSTTKVGYRRVGSARLVLRQHSLHFPVVPGFSCHPLRSSSSLVWSVSWKDLVCRAQDLGSCFAFGPCLGIGSTMTWAPLQANLAGPLCLFYGLESRSGNSSFPCAVQCQFNFQFFQMSLKVWSRSVSSDRASCKASGQAS